MKRKISDILDGYTDQSLEFENSTPLSQKRIKELTMNRIKKKERRSERIGFRVLVAAVVVATMVLAAVAAEAVFGAGDWFREILNIQLAQDTMQADEIGVNVPETISQGQIEVVNQLGKVFEEETQTDQGTTVTMHAAYGDAYILHLYFSVEAPEGTVLPDDILYIFHDGNEEYTDLDQRYRFISPGEDAPYDTISQQVNVEALPDEDPEDNKKDFHVTVNGQAGTECKFNDGYSKYFNIWGIYQQVPNVDGDQDGYELLAPGKFAFDVGLVGENQTIRLPEAEGFVYGGAKTRTWTHDSPCLDMCQENLTGETDPDTGLPIHSESWVYEVTVKKMAISPMGVDWEVEYVCDDAQLSYGLEFLVVMKDGTSPITGIYGSRSDAPQWLTGGPGIGTGLSYFTIPIDLAQVDYILIGDEELGQTLKLYLPE